MQAIIVEDEKRNVNVLTELLAEYCPAIKVVAVAGNVKEAINAISQLKPDLVFLDVELPDGTGFSVVEAFPKDHFSIIFVTAYEHYAIKAIRACALDYLLKPVDIDDLVAAVNKVKAEQSSPDLQKRKEILMHNNRQSGLTGRKIALPTMEGLLFISQDDIIYCAAESNYTRFILTTKEKILVSKPLAYFEELLDEVNFCRTHQSFLVNLNHVQKYVKGRGGYLVMTDGSMVEVSLRMKGQFLERFNK